MMRTRTARLVATLVLTVAGTSMTTMLAGCNTVEGAGKDIEAVGRGTSEAAKATGDAISGK